MIKVNYDEKTGRVISFNKDTVPFIVITEQERKQPLPDKYSYYAVIDGKFIIARNEPTEEEIKEDKARAKHKRMAEIEQWLRDNDWKFNKVFLGEWEATDARWLEYLEQRKLYRAEFDALEQEGAE